MFAVGIEWLHVYFRASGYNNDKCVMQVAGCKPISDLMNGECKLSCFTNEIYK